MMINDENKKSFRKMLKGRALYIALGICVLGAGIVGYTSMNISTPKSTESTGTATEQSTYKNVSKAQFHSGIDEISTTNAYIEEVTENTVTEAPETEQSTEPSTQAVFEDNSPTLEATTAENTEISFNLPVNGTLGKDYSMGLPVFSQTMSDYRTHNGIDITAEKGTQVKAAAPGTVTAVESDSVWGNTVEIDHGAGYVTRISGLADEGLIQKGCSVYPETVIGVVGNIPVEAQEDEHIHFEIRLNGELQDPLEVLGLTQEENVSD